MAGYDPASFHADVHSIRQCVTDNTILIVASAPGYAQGVIDPIREIGQVALEKDVLFHVDGCVGGIHLSWGRPERGRGPAGLDGNKGGMRWGHVHVLIHCRRI